MIFQERDYQIEADESLYRYFVQHGNKSGNPLIAMPTGTGKALVIAKIIKRYHSSYSRMKTLVVTHVKELVEQNHSKFTSYWKGAPAGINCDALKKRDYSHPIIFASVQSIYQDARLFGKVDMLIIDEAHLVSPDAESRYQKLIAELKLINLFLVVVGLTATPWRLGQGKLTDEGGLFHHIVFDVTGLEAFNRFISEGYLCPLVPRPLKTFIDTDGVSKVGGDFVANELQKAADKEVITRAAIQETLEVADDRKVWLVFATGIEHCSHISSILDEYGISNVEIHSKLKGSVTDPQTGRKISRREYNYNQWRSGKVKCAVSMGVLTTGVDYPEIDLIIMLRPTLSPVLWVQMLGRGTRCVYAPGFDLNTTEGRLAAIEASQKHNTLVLDFARNTKRLGPINDPVLPRKKGDKKGDAPIKECPVCGNYCHPSVRFCGGKPEPTDLGCGHKFFFEVKITNEASTDDLIRFEAPIVEEFQVDRILYSAYDRVGFPRMLKVSYYTKSESKKRSRKFVEHLCFEHAGPARTRAIRWWIERTGNNQAPEKVIEVLKQSEQLRASTHIRVHTNKKFPEILAHCYDGTYFGKSQQISGKPFIEKEDAVDFSAIMPRGNDLYTAPSNNSIEDDDIPF